MRNFIVIGILIWVCVGCVSAQSSEMDNLCTAINEKVVIPQKPLKVDKDRYVTACIFKLTFANDKYVQFRVEKHRKIKDASFELETLRLDRISKKFNDDQPTSRYENNIDSTGFWDEAAHSDDSYSLNFILIRQGKYFIQILGSDLSVIKRTECLMRSIRFDHKVKKTD